MGKLNALVRVRLESGKLVLPEDIGSIAHGKNGILYVYCRGEQHGRPCRLEWRSPFADMDGNPVYENDVLEARTWSGKVILSSSPRGWWLDLVKRSVPLHRVCSFASVRSVEYRGAGVVRGDPPGRPAPDESERRREAQREWETHGVLPTRPGPDVRKPEKMEELGPAYGWLAEYNAPCCDDPAHACREGEKG